MRVLFDLDGTLEDSRNDMIAATNRVREALELDPRDADTLRPHMSKGMSHLYFHCFDEVLEDADEGSEAYREVQRLFERDYLRNICVETKLYAGIPELLDELSGVARLGVVTNKPEEHSVALLSALRIAGYFDVVVGGDTTEKTKPSPLPLRHAARALKSDGPVVMIGDSAGDLKMARTAGVTSIWCAWGYNSAPGSSAPDMIARLPADIPRLLEQVK